MKLRAAPLAVRDICLDGSGQVIVGGCWGPATENQLTSWAFDIAAQGLANHAAWGISAESAGAHSFAPYRGGLLLCGFAPAADGAWSGGAFTESQLLLHLSVSAGIGSNAPPLWAQTDVPGTVTDITIGGSLDTGAGDTDSLLIFRELL